MKCTCRNLKKYCGGELIGCDEDSNLFKGLLGSMIVGLQKSIPYVIKSIPKHKLVNG